MGRLTLFVFCFILCACSGSVSDKSDTVGIVSDTIKASPNYVSTSSDCPTVNKYFSIQGVYVSEYFSVFDSLEIDLNNDGKNDYLYVLSPISLDSRFECETPVGKRELVEFINMGNRFTVRNRYSGLISNLGGVMSKYSGISLIEGGFEITHESGSRYSWTYSTEFTIESDSIYLNKIKRICSFDGQEEESEFTFTKKSASMFDVMDSINVDCNCNASWDNLKELGE